jgi:hypothetical protein
MAAPTSKTVRNRMLTPLWVVSLFISLTEAVLGIAAAQTTGGVQIALTAFVIAFPILISIGFFLLLWYRPHHLYAPAEYGHQVNVSDYVQAMTQRQVPSQSELFDAIQKAVQSTITSTNTVTELSKVVSDEESAPVRERMTQALRTVADRTVESIRESGFLTVDLRPLDGPSGPILELVPGSFEHVGHFLDKLWFAMRPPGRPPAYTYGETWVLEDVESGRQLSRLWGSSERTIDRRSLQEAGIVPGMRLRAVPLQKDRQI